jgi:uncharacterized membrane protein YdbT with pleckstrin-like domain
MPVLTPQPIPSALPERRTPQVVLVGMLIAGAAILLGTLVLWFHYGTAVFFEMIAAGFNACF